VSLTFTILGCGSSGGVPRVGQGWGACDPNNPKNRRRRCSLFVERRSANGAKTQVLVDMSPDLREQMLGLEINRLDAILLTHSHADHIHGIDEIRPLVIMAKRKIDLHMDAETAAIVRENFSYIFETPPGSQYPALLNEHRIITYQIIKLNGLGGPVEAVPFQLEHGEIGSLGFRFGGVAYTPDLNAIPKESLAYLEGLDLWIVDALRYTAHPSHFSLPETLIWIARLKPRRAVLTNLHTDLDFERLRNELPAHVEPAFDGMKLFV
jgi:phosphoribosyl 1,2-cyclic phosphate phosphodiesterase